MEQTTLVALLDEDREMILANLARDRSLPAAQAALEKAVDRVMYRYVEACEDETMREDAQYLLQAIRNALPIMDAVGEAKVWKKQTEAGEKEKKPMGGLAIALLLAGGALVLAAVLGVLIAGHTGGALAFLKALLPVALGGVCLFFAGVKAAKPGKDRGKTPEAEAVRTEYLADVEKALHCLRGALLQADGQLERMRAEAAARKQKQTEVLSGGDVDHATLELLSGLLESAYASADAEAREAVSAIRFYLHNARIEAVDYEEGRERWFEFLPAPGAGTIRPALVCEGKLLKKGLAASR